MKKFNNFLNNQIFVAVLLIFIPLINYINPINLKQLSFHSLLTIFLFTLIIGLLIISLVFFLERFFFKKKIYNIYIISSLFYVFLFFYSDIKIFIDNLNPVNPDKTQFINWRYYGEISLSVIISLIFLIIYLNQKNFYFRKFFKTFIIFFISINILLNFLNHIRVNISSKYIDNETLTLSEINISNIKTIENIKINNKNNIYSIFDAMISLENAYKQKIIPNEDTL